MRAILTALAVLTAFPAGAQDVMPFEKTKGAEVGKLVILNQMTAETATTTEYVINGIPVIVYYESTPNWGPTDPRDIVRITVPDGYMAIPSDALVPELEALEVMIYEALIG